MTSRLRAHVLNILLLAASLAVGLAAGEIVLRLWRPQPLDAAYTWPDGTLRHIPSFRHTYTRGEFSNSVGYNALGLRGPEVAPRKSPSVPRVLFLGDSFTEGKQVADEEVLTAVLNELAAARGRRLEVVNAGVSGTGTAEELILWERLGRSLRPDLVVLGFYPNDVRNNVDHGLFDLEGGRAVAAKEPPLPNVRWIYEIRKFLASRSHAYMLFKQALQALRDEDPLRRRTGVFAEGWSGPRPLEAEDVFAAPPSPVIARGWALTLALLDEIRAGAEAAGARLVVAVFPTRFQVDDLLWAEQARKIGVDPARFDLRAPQRILAEWARRTGVPVIDLLDPFREGNSGNTYYFDIDAHWRPNGHALAAEAILDALEARGLIPLTPSADVPRPGGTSPQPPGPRPGPLGSPARSARP